MSKIDFQYFVLQAFKEFCLNYYENGKLQIIQ